MKRLLSILLAILVLASMVSVTASAETEGKEVKILFTHDIHSYFDTTTAMVDGKVREHGGAARLKTLIEENSDENTVYLDAGDFSMGTLLQAGYATDAYELRILGQLGCDVTTFGNHEYDFGGVGAAQMLRSAISSGDPLPEIVQSNMIITGSLTDDQQTLADAMADYGAKSYTLLDVNGITMAVFGLLGIDGIECAPTSGMDFENYIDAAKSTVEDIRKNTDADLIVCLSHCGTSGDGENGEDVDLAKAVPDIDVIISGHSHTKYAQPIMVGDTIVVSCGEYLSHLGSLTLDVSESGARCTEYKNIPCDESVADDEIIAETIERYKQNIRDTYLAAENVGYDDVLCHCGFDFMPLGEMYATHQEYPMGNLIADSYMYEARRNGIDDIDVALVVLGTIRGSFYEGDVTVSDAFEICSLGVGADGSAGHPIASAYITGKEMKLLVELDASLGPMVSSIKMSYSGLRYTFNTKRMLLDRVTEVYLVREDGTEELIKDDQLYKAACNMYAVNMLGMLNGLTHGILSVTPKYADGTPVEDFYTCSMMNKDGGEIKEWVAFMNYLSSLPEKDGVPTIPEKYSAPEGRKYKISEGGFAVIKNPGATTLAVMILILIIIAVVVILCLTHKKRKAKRQAKRERRLAKKAQRVK